MTESANVISLFTGNEDRHRGFRLRPLAQAEEVEIGTTEAAYSRIASPALSPSPQFVIAPIATFAPEPYELNRPLPVTIYKSGEEEYTASLFDANLHTSGDNEQEAFENLKSLLLDVFDSLSARSPEELGPGPRRQLSILKRFIHKA